MIQFLWMAVLALIAAALLTRPWWSGLSTARLPRRAANVTAYQTRLAEIDEDLASGLVDAESAAALKNELGARLVSDAEPLAPAPPTAMARNWTLSALIALLLGIFGGLAYYAQGSWKTQTIIDTARRDPAAAQQLAIQAMVEGLSLKLKKNPEDIEGWAMLGRSYSVMERYEESAKAYARANEISKSQNPDLLVSEGEALAMQQQRDLQGRPRELFDAALKLDAQNGKALWYGGLAAAQGGDYKLAQQRLVALTQQDIPEELRQVLQQRLQELSQLSGEPLPKAEAAKPAAVAESGLSLKLHVELAPELAQKLQPGLTLFVFAKAENGPPMPLAVQRLPDAQLPLNVTLDDSMAMMPQLKLSQHERWVVTARLTRGGTVQAESGDLQGQRTLNQSDAGKPQRIVINTRLP